MAEARSTGPGLIKPLDRGHIKKMPKRSQARNSKWGLVFDPL